MADRASKRYGKETEAKGEGAKKPDEKTADAVSGDTKGASPAPAAPAVQGAAPPDVKALFDRLAKERQATADRHDKERTQMNGRHASDHKALAKRHEEEVASILNAGGGSAAPEAGGTPGVGGSAGNSPATK